LAEAIHWLGPDLLTAYKLALGVTLIGAAWSAAALGLDWFASPAAGVVAGIAYLYSPYMLYDAHIRGSLPETLALAFLPLVLLFVRRAAQGQGAAIGWGALTVAGMVLAHNGVSVQVLPFVGLFGLWAGWRAWPTNRAQWRGFMALAALFALGLALTAFFLLPALFEAAFVQIERGTANGAMNYRDNFLTLTELLRWPTFPVRPDLLNPPVIRALPMAAIWLALGAVARWHGWSALTRRMVAALAIGLLATVFLITPLARPVWDHIPLLQLTLFPWRILGLASLLIALVAGAVITPAFPGRSAAVPIVSVVMMISAVPFYTPPFEPAPSAPTLAEVARFEIPPVFIGTTTVGEYLPRWAQTLPDTRASQAQLIAGQPVIRVPPDTLPADATLTPLTSSALGERFRVQSAAPFTLTYHMFYFPGWRVTLNDQPAELHISAPHGLMQVALPAGSTTVDFHFGDTPIRVLGNGISLGALWVTLTVIGITRSRASAAPKPEPLAWRVAALWGVAPVLVWALARPLLVAPGLQPDGTLAGVAHPLQTDFSGELTLLGWEADRVTLGADDTFLLNLYWRAAHRVGIPLGVRVRLIDAAGRVWSQPDTPRPADWRFTPGTDQWPLDHYILDPYLITPLIGAPPGVYQLEITVFSGLDLRALATETLGDFTLTHASRRAAAAPRATFDTIALDDFSLERETAAPGDVVSIATVWRHLSAAETPPITVALVNADGSTVTQWVDHWPAFAPGEVARRVHEVRVPVTLASGVYTWQVSVEGARPVFAASQPIIAPARVFTAPPAIPPLPAALGPVTLWGYDHVSNLTAGQTLALTLLWRAERDLPINYRVFVHLVDAADNLVAQSDGIPADWSRPTLGWLPGEYVTDPRSLPVPAEAPPGLYTLWAGMYAPDGTRLTTPAYPEGRIPLGTVTIR
jgi:hypothetical protein